MCFLSAHLNAHPIDLEITVGYHSMTVTVFVPLQVDLDEGVTPGRVGEIAPRPTVDTSILMQLERLH